MAIVSSVIIEQHRQTDGRWDITEKHIDHIAKEYIINYLSEPSADPNNPPANVTTLLASHAIQLWDNLKSAEIDKYIQLLESNVLPSPAVINPNYEAKLKILEKLIKRACRMRALDSMGAITLINWIKANYNVTQIASFLGISTTVVNAIIARFSDLETKIKPLLITDDTKVVELE
jgi:hypothetical protein